jgi:hypothetical protein
MELSAVTPASVKMDKWPESNAQKSSDKMPSSRTKKRKQTFDSFLDSGPLEA